MAKKKASKKKTTKKVAKKAAKRTTSKKKVTKKSAPKKVAKKVTKKKTTKKKTPATKKKASKIVKKVTAKPAKKSPPPKPVKKAAAPKAKAPKAESKKALRLVDDDPRSPDEVEFYTTEELAAFKELLTQHKITIMAKARAALESGDINLDTNEMADEVDLASATIAQNLQFRLLDRDRKLLNEIEHALNKIEHGDYGFCEGTGELIPKRRLELRPWTRHSVKFKEQIERMKKSGRGVSDEDQEAF